MKMIVQFIRNLLDMGKGISKRKGHSWKCIHLKNYQISNDDIIQGLRKTKTNPKSVEK